MNLVANARDTMLQGGILTIETQNFTIDKKLKDFNWRHIPNTPGTHDKLMVSDTGAGMDELTRQNVFESFYTNKDAGLGIGLGLAAVYDIVKQSEVYIFVDSAVGKGTTFEFYLPQIDEEIESAAEDNIFN